MCLVTTFIRLTQLIKLITFLLLLTCITINSPKAESLDPELINAAPFSSLCYREPKDIICSGHITNKKLTYQQVVDVDQVAKKLFVYEEDSVQYNVLDLWSAHNPGDCEDYALIVSNILAMLGEDGRYMKLIMLELPAGAHAALQVETSDKGTIEFGSITEEIPFVINIETKFNVFFHEIRQAYITMDGQRQITPYPGYELRADGYVGAIGLK